MPNSLQNVSANCFFSALLCPAPQAGSSQVETIALQGTAVYPSLSSLYTSAHALLFSFIFSPFDGLFSLHSLKIILLLQ